MKERCCARCFILLLPLLLFLISCAHPLSGDQEPIGMPHITTVYLRPLQDYPADTRLKVHLTDLSKRPSALCMELYQ